MSDTLECIHLSSPGTNQRLHSCIRLIDIVSGTYDLWRPTEEAATRSFCEKNRINALSFHAKRVHNTEHEVLPIQIRFQRDVDTVKGFLTKSGGIECETRRGYKAVYNIGRIVDELYVFGLHWIMPSHVREAQNQIKDKKNIKAESDD